MITKIGIVSGQILELLDRNKGVLVFDEIYSSLNQPRDLVLMGLGWLLHERYLHIIKDPWKAAYQEDGNKKAHDDEGGIFDLVVGNKTTIATNQGIKNMQGQIDDVAGKILILLEGYGGMTDLQTIVPLLKEHRDIVLMGLGWLIREGYLKGIFKNNKIFVFRLQKEKACSKMGSMSV